jgi:hypothetical protein
MSQTRVEEILTAIEKLNECVYEAEEINARDNQMHFYTPFTMNTDGNTYLVMFLGVAIYNSDDTFLEFVGEEETTEESIESFLMREANKLVKDVSRLRF